MNRIIEIESLILEAKLFFLPLTLFFKYNMTETNSSDFTHIKLSAIEILSRIEPYYVAILVTVGLVGNSLSFAIFVSSKLK